MISPVDNHGRSARHGRAPGGTVSCSSYCSSNSTWPHEQLVWTWRGRGRGGGGPTQCKLIFLLVLMFRCELSTDRMCWDKSKLNRVFAAGWSRAGARRCPEYLKAPLVMGGRHKGSAPPPHTHTPGTGGRQGQKKGFFKGGGGSF